LQILLVSLFTPVIGTEFRCSPYTFNYSPADPFRDLRDDGVSESSQTVHSLGNPISHSTHVGFSCPVIPSALFTESHSELFGVLPAASNVSGFRPPFHSRLVGVGHIPVFAIATKLFAD
jgi:hypothetical protein